MPDRLRRNSRSPHLAVLINSPKDLFVSDAAGSDPFVDGGLCPNRDWNSSDMFSLANEVGDHPMVLSELQIFSVSSTDSFALNRNQEELQSARGCVYHASCPGMRLLSNCDFVLP